MSELAEAAVGQRYYGKYRGTVVNNVDPMQIGRLQAIVPDVSGVIPTSWALPCLPGAGINTGVFTVPQIGSGVWIEFEQGDPDRPIWVGGYWGTAAERPVLSQAVPPAVSGFTIQTTLKNGIVVSDVPGPTGGILIQTTTGAMISVSDVGIVISNGKGATINMVGPSVDVNLGAVVLCTHAGTATPAAPFPRVLLSGQPCVTLASPYLVAGCALTGTPNPPCVTGQWLTGAVRVLAGGVPLATMAGSSTCVPTGTPLLPVNAQPRVLAT